MNKVTPHPHAALIMKYAEVAQTRVDPWVEFEVSCHDGWLECDSTIIFLAGLTYRHKNWRDSIK